MAVFNWRADLMIKPCKAVLLALGGLFAAGSVLAQENYSPQPLVLVADDLTPLDEGALPHLESLVSAGGIALDNAALIVNGGEVRRLAAAMPLAPQIRSYMRQGLTVFVCRSAAELQHAVDGLPLVSGIRALPDSSLPKAVAERFNAYCYVSPQMKEDK